ncbi:MAG: glycerol kinase GlpK [Candidatus Omnitrophica bacterium]|nr:glycerol kinase GlpK [Candidatus Omnitrophota bacterium]
MKNLKQYILSIDQGTTGTRAILYDKQGMAVQNVYLEFPQYFPKPGWVEHDPNEIWYSVYKSIQKVLDGVSPSAIAAIGITNQRETTVLWDKETGSPVYNAIVWQCRRTSRRCDELKKRKGVEKLFREKTGLPIDAYFSATKIEWILKNVPGALKKAQQGKLLFGTTDAWVLWKLTGGKVHATDYTNASRTMVFNIKSLAWDKDLLKEFHIPESILPEVKQSSGVFGHTVKTGNLPAGIPIAGIAGDQQAALFGQTCFTPGDIKNTYGTGAFILLNTGTKRTISKHGLITTLACGKNGEPVYALEGAVFIAGAAIQWLRDGLRIIESAKETQAMALSLKNNEGVYFVPALVGLGAPYWDQDARGVIVGITRGTTRKHLARAALEAMAYQTKDVLMAMQKDSGLKVKGLKVDGGSAANDFLCQFQADILGVPIVRPQTIETTSLGAAYLAGLAVGYWKNTNDIMKCWMKDKIFSPKMNRESSLQCYSGWQNAVNKTLSK